MNAIIFFLQILKVMVEDLTECKNVPGLSYNKLHENLAKLLEKSSTMKKIKYLISRIFSAYGLSLG